MNLVATSWCLQVMHSACDIEGHRGEDGRFYLLDFARSFPPEYPPEVMPLLMYRLGLAYGALDMRAPSRFSRRTLSVSPSVPASTHSQPPGVSVLECRDSSIPSFPRSVDAWSPFFAFFEVFSRVFFPLLSLSPPPSYCANF